MNKENGWIHTGESENGLLKLWVRQTIVDGEKYLQYKYTDLNDNTIDTIQTIPFKQITLLKGLKDILEMEYGI